MKMGKATRVWVRSRSPASQIKALTRKEDGQISDPTIADSVIDRLLNKSHHMTLTGESMRSEVPLLS